MRSNCWDFIRPYGAIVLAVMVAACAAPKPALPPERQAAPVPPSGAAPPGTYRMIVLVPQSDESLAACLRLLGRHPGLRAVLAVSPRFKSVASETPVKIQINNLQKERRVELALQLPNAPFLPLLIDTNAARDALPAGGALPNPPFSYPDDVIQIIARAKADFFHAWHALPRGIVLPYGAASPALLSLFDHLGFTWLVAALGAPPAPGPFSSRALQIWDGGSAASEANVLVWDERLLHPVDMSLAESWIRESAAAHLTPVLPSDTGLASAPLPPPGQWKRRTWLTADWSRWIGSPAKNAAWNALRITREALEKYKNSGQASVQRLDMAFEEIYTAENSNFFAAIGNEALSPVQSEERAHEFQATLSGVYRLMNRMPPDDLFTPASAAPVNVQASTMAVVAETLADGRDHLAFPDPVGDGQGDGRLPLPQGVDAGAYDLERLDIWASTQAVTFGVKLARGDAAWKANPGPLVDIYIDVNNVPNAGTTAFLPLRGLSASPSDAWEYAVTLTSDKGGLYRTQSGGTFTRDQSLTVLRSNGEATVSVPRTLLRGNPRRWGYQVLVMARDPESAGDDARPLNPSVSGSVTPPVYDFLDPLDIPQADLLRELEAGQRSSLPFIRLPSGDSSR
ncbi:MAG TPA: glucodextranase DOMON-like domain-containing protein [Elusimicrobiota bacterium]|nr:glucodextranase DOMON-like domain-containing protein [Elusimicrobiota bacterium]